jgi:hypothetical protein
VGLIVYVRVSIDVLSSTAKWRYERRTYLLEVSQPAPVCWNCDGVRSQIAHPNLYGAFGLYAEINRAELTARFGPRLKGWKSVGSTITHSLVAALADFGDAYNRVLDTMPAFLAELGKLPDSTPAPSD